MALDYIQMLKVWLHEHRNTRLNNMRNHYDYVLVSGDIANVNHNQEGGVSKEEE